MQREDDHGPKNFEVRPLPIARGLLKMRYYDIAFLPMVSPALILKCEA